MKMLSSKKILYVEDDQDTALLMQLSCADAGYEITVAGTVAEALAIAKTKEFDTFLVESLLPDGSGADLCFEIRKFNVNTPIVFFSASVFESDRRNAAEAGAAAFIAKPAYPDHVLEQITLLIQGSPKRAQLPRTELVKARGVRASSFETVEEHELAEAHR